MVQKYTNILSILLLLCFLGKESSAALFRPETAGDLVAAISVANNNGQDDVIDLGGCLFSITTSFGGSCAAFPAIKADNRLTPTSHSLTIKDGTIDISLISNACARHFQVNPGATLYLESVKLKHGHPVGSGGSIYNLGSVGTKYVSFLSNGASENGGAIYNCGYLSVANSTFSENLADNGGAIYNDSYTMSPVSIGTVNQLFNSTFSDNTANDGNGGAINNNEGFIVSMTNNTLVSNVATSNGGGIYNLSSSGINIQQFVSNIVATNSANDGPDIYDLTAGIANPSYNLIGVGGLAGGNFIIGNNYNLVGSIGSPLNPMLGPLEYNGGRIWTIAPEPSSLAIGNGKNPLSLHFDERGPGYARMSGYQTDIGAVELQDCDSDGDFDECDCDEDQDGVCDEFDNCPKDANPGQDDCNHNGVGDDCDDCPCPCPDNPCEGECDSCPAHTSTGSCPGQDHCRRCPLDGDEDTAFVGPENH